MEDIFTSRKRAMQLINFSGCKIGNKLLTDIDAAGDYNGELFVFIEVKGVNKELPLGQRLFLQRLIDHLDVPAVCFIARHDTRPEEDIMLDSLPVVLFRTNSTPSWRVPKEQKTVRESILHFYNWHVKEKQ